MNIWSPMLVTALTWSLFICTGSCWTLCRGLGPQMFCLWGGASILCTWTLSTSLLTWLTGLMLTMRLRPLSTASSSELVKEEEEYVVSLGREQSSA